MKKKFFLPIVSMVLTFAVCFGLLSISEFPAQAAENDWHAKTKDAVVLYIKSPIAYVKNTPTFIDSGDLNATPIIENGRTLVPLRFITEAFGAEVAWEKDTKKATIKTDGKEIILTVGQKEMLVNGESIQMDVSPKIMNENTFVPLGFLAAAMGKEVFFNRGLIIVSNTKDIYNKDKDRAVLDEMIAKVNNLPTFGTKENFTQLVGKPEAVPAKTARLEDSQMKMMDEMDAPRPTSAMTASADTNGEAGSTPAAEYSTTNVQVQGVDEGDVIKTDGEYIYYLKQDGRISVVKANPPEKMSLDFTISIEDKEFYPEEIYLDGNNLVVIGQSRRLADWDRSQGSSYGVSVTRAYVFDISDRKNVKQLREVESDGRYISSGKIGDSVYFITNLSMHSLVYNGEFVLPSYRDTTAKDQIISTSYDEVYYFPTIYANPNGTFQNYMMVTGFEMDKSTQKAKVNTFFGGGENIYCSMENLYIASTNYHYNVKPVVSAKKTASLSSTVVGSVSNSSGTTDTTVYQFALNGGNVKYAGRQDIPGTVLNQFSMDENNGYFRIATTSYDKNYKESNNLYVLDKDMNIAGKIQNIAPGEKIYSARFMGSRAYMVTFKTVDPLFVIDLKDPANPTILGALKIPGYSDYLHPYDENHLIGFGKDTVEQHGNAYYKGMKMSMFDVTDVSNPKEMFVELIGDRGTDSELLQNHRALLFSKDKNLMAFPVTLAEVKNKDKTKELEYGEFVYQGAYVYGIDLEKGFQLRGRITHMEDSDMLKSGMYGGDYNQYINRILYIGDNLYTVSNQKIKATGLSDMKEKGSITLE